MCSVIASSILDVDMLKNQVWNTIDINLFTLMNENNLKTLYGFMVNDVTDV